MKTPYHFSGTGNPPASQVEQNFQKIEQAVPQFVNVMEYGAIQDGGATDQTTAVQAAIDQNDAPMTIFVPPGVAFTYSDLTFPGYNINILDCGDPRFTRLYIHGKASGASVEENEFILGATYHTGFALDNLDSRTSLSGSFVWRKNGTGVWQLGVDLAVDGNGLIGVGTPEVRFVQLMDSAGASIESTRWQINEHGQVVAYAGASPGQGSTANRPANPTTGCCWFDTDLNRPIWYTGTAWIKADGTSA